MQPAACRASPQGAPLTRARPVFLPFPAFPHPFSAFLRAFSALPPHPFQHLPKFLARPFRISRIFSSHFSRSFSALSPHYFSVFSRHFQIPSAPFPHFARAFSAFPRTLAPPAARPACPFFRSCFASAQASKTVRWSRFQGGQIRSRKKSKTQGRRARAKRLRPVSGRQLPGGRVFWEMQKNA